MTVLICMSTKFMLGMTVHLIMCVYCSSCVVLTMCSYVYSLMDWLIDVSRL